MAKQGKNNIAILMYTHYKKDPRLIREAEVLAESGYNVDCYTLTNPAEKEPRTEHYRGVNIIRLNQNRYRGDSGKKFILGYIEFFTRCFFLVTYKYFTKQYNLIQINNLPDFLVFSMLIPRLLGAKLILDIRDPMPTTYITKYEKSESSLMYKLLLWQELWSAKFVDHVLAAHEPNKQEVLVKHGIPADKILPLTNFANEEVFTLNKTWQLDDKIKLVYHGTIAERFGLHNVIEVFPKLENPDLFHFTIIGDGEFSQELHSKIAELGLAKHITFDNQFYDYNLLPSMIKEHNVGFVSYTLSTATDQMLPVKMLEYVSIGMPVITVKNTAIKYYFGDDELLYYNPEDPKSLESLLNKLAKNREQIRINQSNILKIRDRFFWALKK